MFFNIISGIILGLVAGTIAGLIPGIHSNLISAIVLSSASKLSVTNIEWLLVFIVTTAITQTFVDFIPSIFLGAPEDDTVLSVLPGHELLKEGKGHEAIVLATYGSLLAIPLIILLSIVFIHWGALIEKQVAVIIPFVLISMSIYSVLREKNIVWAALSFLLAGYVGFASLNLPVKEPLLPLLSGLFGASGLIVSINNKISLQEQETFPLKNIKITKSETKKALLGSIVSAPICAFLPAVGSGYAGMLGSEIINQTRKSFIILVGILNTLIMGLSFAIVSTIGKSRSGAAAAVKSIVESFGLKEVLLITISILISAVVASFITIKISKIFARGITKVSYKWLSLSVLCVLLLAVVIFSNVLGIVIFFTSTAIGVFTIKSGSRRINMMACLIIPTIIFYLST